ncbi:unnamed protein product, partial [Vitis vinifera]
MSTWIQINQCLSRKTSLISCLDCRRIVRLQLISLGITLKLSSWTYLSQEQIQVRPLWFGR